MTIKTTILRRLSDSLTLSPHVYDKIQFLAGFPAIIPLLQPYLDEIAGYSLLDVGAGTGLYMPLFPSTTRYIWSDIDPKKLEGFRAKAANRSAETTFGFMSDSMMLALGDKTVDYALCAAMSHHISNEVLDHLFKELARVVKKKLIFIDALKSPRLVSRMLWAVDRGSFPRTSPSLCFALERYFDIESLEPFEIYHQYILCISTPKENEAVH
jgi:ubiquinone/menaquinone biosynthesis C-methylase UbiE